MRTDKRKEYENSYYLKNKEKRGEYSKQYQEKNKEKRKKYMNEYSKNNSEIILEYKKSYDKDRNQKDILFKLTGNVRRLILGSFNNDSHRKTSKTTDILGCTFEQFKQYIESKFEPWMTWDNRGGRNILGPNMTWDLDHIIPVSSAVNEDDIKRLNHYTNFQPLCSYQNRFIKKDKI